MAWGCRHLVVLVAALLATLGAAGSAQAASSCGTRVIDDWRDGRVDGVYPVACYREALQGLPEDLRIYSSAQSDITRALQHRVRAERTAAQIPQSSGGGTGVSPYLVAVISVALVLGFATVATLTR
jgi:hypothetical protein